MVHDLLQRRFDSLLNGFSKEQAKSGPYELRGKRTIKWHRRNIMDKLDVRSLVEMVSFSEHLGLQGESGSDPA